MKQNKFWKSAMNYLIVISFLTTLISCMQSVPLGASHAKRRADSIQIFYDRIACETFSSISANMFLEEGIFNKNRIMIRDTVLCDYLASQKDALRKTEDPLLYIDTRILCVFYQSEGRNDSLYVGAYSTDCMQLNQDLMQPDSVLWVKIRDVLVCQDSIFKKLFQNNNTYYTPSIHYLSEGS